MKRRTLIEIMLVISTCWVIMMVVWLIGTFIFMVNIATVFDALYLLSTMMVGAEMFLLGIWIIKSVKEKVKYE